MFQHPKCINKLHILIAKIRNIFDPYYKIAIFLIVCLSYYLSDPQEVVGLWRSLESPGGASL